MNVKQLMLSDLERRLDNRKILVYDGADVPGETVVYCTSATLTKASEVFIRKSHGVAESNDMHSPADVKDVLDIDTSKTYHKLVANWNDTGDCYCVDSNIVGGLRPAIQVNLGIQELALSKGEITEDEVAFCDDNDELLDGLSQNISEDTIDEYYESH